MNNARAILLLLLTAPLALAQDDDKGLSDEQDPKLASWKWSAELRLPDKDGPYVALPVPSALFGKAQDYLHDVRIADAQGTRIPYVRRVLNEKSEPTPIDIKRQFNAGPSAKAKIYEMSIELGDVPAPGHNDIEIETTGRQFRRKVEVLGDTSDKFANPQQLLDKNAYLIHFDVDNRLVEVRRFRYDFKQFRFLQVRVHADPSEEETPKITRVTVRRTVVQAGEYVTEPADLGERDLVRGQGGPGSAWLITLPNRMPVEKVTLQAVGRPRAGPIELQIAEPDQPPTPITLRDWRWRNVKQAENPGEDGKDVPGERLVLEITFKEEVAAKRLRLVVTDFANEPLNLRGVTVTRAAQKLIFEKPDLKKLLLPIGLYSGNEAVGAPNYELAGRLPVLLTPSPAAASLGEMQPNPSYIAPVPPLHERLPWLVYVVLGAACAVLLAILAVLSLQTIKQHDKAASEKEDSVSAP